MRRLVAACVLVAALAAGCGGGGGSEPYTAAATVPCLKKEGFRRVTTDPAKIGFIAAFAENGGLQARTRDGNVVTIAFAADPSGVPAKQSAFLKRASPFYKRHIADVMQSSRNAVLVWQTAPSQEQIDTVKGCLGS